MQTTLLSTGILAAFFLCSVANANAQRDDSLDTAFVATADGETTAFALQSDGKIVLTGAFSEVNGVAHNNLARLHADGTLDPTYNPSTDGVVLATALQPDGKRLIGGYFTSVNGVAHGGLARLGPDGIIDSGFNPTAVYGEDQGVFALALQPDGEMVIGGAFQTVNNVAHGSLARVKADGSLDAAFGAYTDGEVDALLLQPDGKILVGGNFQTVYHGAHGGVARLNADGTPDTGFNASVDGLVYALVLQPDGKIVLGGTFSYANGVAHQYLARLNADGSLDTSFNASVNDRVFALAVQSDGKLLVGGGFTQANGAPRGGLARLNADGTLDLGFATTLADGAGSALISALTVQGDGKLLVGGDFTSVNDAAHGDLARLAGGGRHAAFFDGAVPLTGGVYYLAFSSGAPFGYYSDLADSHYIYHFDLGYEYVFDAADGKEGVYLYDFQSQGFFYTSPTFPFPYLYDFSLNSVVYYYPDPGNPGRYNTDGHRFFYVFNTGKIISK